MATLEQAECEVYGWDKQENQELKPFFSGNPNAICLSSSEAYAPFASLVLQSIASHSNPKFKYDIVILTTDISYKTQRVLQQSVKNKNISVRFFYVNRYIQGLNFFTWAHFTKNTYFRLLIPDIFSAYKKVLYLDSDVLVCHDISPLFEENLNGCYLAAALDTHVVSYCHIKSRTSYQYNKETLGLKDPTMYFQMGVSLFDVCKINTDFPPLFLINCTQKYRFQWLDQDILNKVFAEKIKQLPNKWNVMVANNYPTLDEYFLPTELRKEYMEARLNPYIIHYIGRAMPCFHKRSDMSEIWWEQARKNPYYEYFLKEQGYLLAHCYCSDHIYNRLPKNGNYWLYQWNRILSHLTWGKTKEKYKQRKNQLRKALWNR